MAFALAPRLSFVTVCLWLVACGDDNAAPPAASSMDTSADASMEAASSVSRDSPGLDTASSRDAGNEATFSAAAPSSHDDASAADAAAGPATSEPSETATAPFELPPSNAGLDYQLGGGYAAPDGVAIVSRDRTDDPASGLYNICYVNGFQVQPGEEEDWEADLLLRDEDGNVIIDEDWDEALLDVSNEDKRARIAQVVGGWIEGCKADGFDAVEIDNLDTFSRSGDRISEDDAVAFVAELSRIAHAVGLAIAQKNAVELVPRRAEMGTDFVVAEECNAWRECDGYIEGYGPYVLMIEYAREDFEAGCAQYADEFSVVLRDRDVTTPESNAYVYEGC